MFGVYSLSANSGSSTSCSRRSITVNATWSGLEFSRMVRMRWRSSVVLPDFGVTEHHQQRVVREVDGDRRQVFLALTDDHALRRRIQRREGRRATGRSGSSRTGGAVTPGYWALMRGDALQRRCGEQEVLGGHRQAAARLVGGHAVGGTAQRPDDADVAVRANRAA